MVKVKVMMPSARFQDPGPRALAHAKPFPPDLQPLPKSALLENVKSPVKFAGGAASGAASEPAALPPFVILWEPPSRATLPGLTPGTRLSTPASVKTAELPALRAKLRPSPLSELADSIGVATTKRGVRTAADNRATRLELASHISGRSFLDCTLCHRMQVRHSKQRREVQSTEGASRTKNDEYVIRRFFRYLVHVARLGSQLGLGKKCRILHNYYRQ